METMPIPKDHNIEPQRRFGRVMSVDIAVLLLLLGRTHDAHTLLSFPSLLKLQKKRDREGDSPGGLVERGFIH